MSEVLSLTIVVSLESLFDNTNYYFIDKSPSHDIIDDMSTMSMLAPPSNL